MSAGVGSRTAQRMAFYLLQRDREGARELYGGAARMPSSTLVSASAAACCQKRPSAGYARRVERDATLICVVESPADVIAIEESGMFRGHYFVLHGRLSPLDGIGPDELATAASLRLGLPKSRSGK